MSTNRFDVICEVQKHTLSTKAQLDAIVEIEKFNPYHDERGRFTSGPGASLGMGVGGLGVAGGKRQALISTLQEVEEKNRHLPREVATVVDPDSGKTIFSKDGNEYGVSFNSSEAKEIRGKVVTHNHPAEVVFSPNDVACAYGLKSIRATTPSGKVYELSGVKDRRVVQDYKAKYLETRAEYFKANGIPEDTLDRNLTSEQRAGSFAHITQVCGKWLADNAAKYHYQYTEEGGS